jgi:hypothetical protein
MQLGLVLLGSWIVLGVVVAVVMGRVLTVGRAARAFDDFAVALRDRHPSRRLVEGDSQVISARARR